VWDTDDFTVGGASNQVCPRVVQKIVDHKGASWGATWIHPYWGQFYSLSYLGMGRGFALSGDVTKARKAFHDFLELWKEADPDVPVLRQAKAEYPKLR
jgi:hypothetical protein